MKISKYWQTVNIAWQNGFTYRASVFLWRFRQLLSSFFALTLWSVIFQNTNQALNYTQSEMISYIFLASIIQSLVMSTVLNGLTSTIYSGDLTNILTKPIGLFKFLAAQEIADKLKNFVFVLLEAGILLYIFQPEFVDFQTQHLIVFFLWLIGGISLNFLIGLLFGAIGFWSPDSWGPRFMFYVITNLTSGKLFPLDVLPELIQNIVWLTPFPFLSFAQTQVLLNRLETEQIWLASIGLGLWLILLLVLVKTVWKSGLKNYSAVGI